MIPAIIVIVFIAAIIGFPKDKNTSETANHDKYNLLNLSDKESKGLRLFVLLSLAYMLFTGVFDNGEEISNLQVSGYFLFGFSLIFPFIYVILRKICQIFSKAKGLQIKNISFSISDEKFKLYILILVSVFVISFISFVIFFIIHTKVKHY